MRFVYSLRVSDSKTRRTKQWPQCLAVITACLCVMAGGTHSTWSSAALPIILSDDFPVNITSEESSYIASIAPLGALLGAPLAGWLANTIGRKNVILLTALPTFAAWMIIAFANSALMFCLGRFFSGVAEGIYIMILPMYAGEVTEPSIRGALSNIVVVSLTLGMLVVSAYTPFLSIRDSSLISAVVPMLLIICFAWMPESPYYLIMKGNVAKARQALYFLRRCDIENDFVVLEKDVVRQMSEKGTLKDLFCIESNRKALLIAGGARVIQQFSGMSARTAYLESIFTQTGANVSPVLSSCIYLLAQLLTSCVTSVLLDKYGRVALLILSCLGTGVFMAIAATYFYLQEVTDLDISSFSWVLIVVLVVAMMFFSIGLGTIPSVLLGELFSASVKGKALCTLCVFNALLMTATTKLFHHMNGTYGMYSSFVLFAVVCFLGVIFAYFVPETRGKSLEEIQQNLKGNGNYVSNVK